MIIATAQQRAIAELQDILYKVGYLNGDRLDKDRILQATQPLYYQHTSHPNAPNGLVIQGEYQTNFFILFSLNSQNNYNADNKAFAVMQRASLVIQRTDKGLWDSMTFSHYLADLLQELEDNSWSVQFVGTQAHESTESKGDWAYRDMYSISKVF